jgi:hypothetical protein
MAVSESRAGASGVCDVGRFRGIDHAKGPERKTPFTATPRKVALP